MGLTTHYIMRSIRIQQRQRLIKDITRKADALITGREEPDTIPNTLLALRVGAFFDDGLWDTIRIHNLQRHESERASVIRRVLSLVEGIARRGAMGTETGVVLTIPGHGGKPLTLARTTSRISYDCSFGWGFDPFLLIVVPRRDQVLKRN